MNRNNQVVIIDDSHAILLVMRSMLAELGYHNIVASANPAAAIEHIRKSPERYSAVFTDLNMPEMDGMEVVKALGEAGYQGGVCIISEMDNRILELAADIARRHKVNLLGNIPKPIPIHALRRMMTKLEQQTQRRASKADCLSREELEEYLDKGYLQPYYQPKVNLLKREIEGVEVLARIAHPGETDAILPGRFIPTAIEYGLLNRMTRMLLKLSLRDLPRLTSEFGDNVKISINLSPSQLTDQTYPDQLIDQIEKYRVDHKQITLEITEDFALENTSQLESINRFRMRGFGLSLDDFGTGFTNVQQLRSLPFTEIKIDRTLISNIHQDQFNQVVVKSLSELSEKLNVSLIAEGLERFEDLNYMESNHLNMNVQGFLICKPKPLDSLVRWYHSWVKYPL